MDVLVIYESHLGHTRRVAQAIAGTMLDQAQVDLERCRPGLTAVGYDLVIIGAPTHRGRLPTPSSRSRLLASLGLTGPTDFGLGEWLDREPAVSAGAVLAAFDTLPPRAGLSRGSAACELVRLLRRTATPVLLPPRSFLLAGPAGPLSPGELDRASRWADRLITTSQVRAPLPEWPNRRGLRSP